MSANKYGSTLTVILIIAIVVVIVGGGFLFYNYVIKPYNNDKETLKKYTKVLYSQARLIEGLTIENPTEISNLVCEIMAK